MVDNWMCTYIRMHIPVCIRTCMPMWCVCVHACVCLFVPLFIHNNRRIIPPKHLAANTLTLFLPILLHYSCSHPPTGSKVVGAHSLEEMVKKLKKPRRVMMLVKAGSAVDAFIDKLVPLLEKGDIIIDGGNSEYLDTQVISITQYNVSVHSVLRHAGN